MSTKFSRVALRLGLGTVSLAVAFVALELSIRTIDLWGVSYTSDVTRYFNEAIALPPDAAHAEGRLFENARLASIEFETFRWRTDERGLRRPWDELANVGGARRVLFLGDSVTLAWGVDAKDSWIRGLERKLEPEVWCQNAGHLRYDTPQAEGYLAAHGEALAPDVIVLTFVTNDLEDSWVIFQEIAATLAEIGDAQPGPAARLREAFRGTRAAWAVLQHKLADKRVEPVIDFSVAPGYAANWSRCEAALDRLLVRANSLDAALVVLDHTVPSVPDLERWCAENGVSCTDFRFTEKEWARGITNSVADRHANALGNELLVEKALPAVRAALNRR